MLLIFETHPVPYHAPVYRSLTTDFGMPVTVLYGSDYSASGYFDREFKVRLSWDSDLLGGYEHNFLARTASGGATHYDEVLSEGMATAADALRPKAVMALGYFHPFDRAAIRYALQRGLPLLFRGETTDTAHERSALRALTRDLILRRFYQRCSHLLYVGQQARQHYLRLGCQESRLVFSPYCVDDRNFQLSETDHLRLRQQTRRELDIPDDALVIMFSGKLSQRKGVDLLPEALRSLPAHLRSRCVLLLLGDGELREDLLRQCAEAPEVVVRFAGFQNQSRLSAYYHSADVLALPSRSSETWGLVVNEALLHGLPCVVSKHVGCQSDLVIPGQTGAICTGGNELSLAKALTEVLSARTPESWATRCRAKALEYSPHAAAHGIHQAWQSLQR